MSIRRKTMLLYLLLLLLVILTGCRSLEVPPEAQKVILHWNATQAVDDCDKLGPLQASAEAQNLIGLSSDNQSTAAKEASILIRKKAFEKYNADTVVLVSSDAIGGIVGVKTKVILYGIAYDCFK
jgi:hypothetical protein